MTDTIRALRGRCGAWMIAALAIGGSAACSARVGPDEVQPGVEAQVLQQTSLDRPWFAVFDWSLRDGRSNFEGSGAARLLPDSARLDLFGPQDVAYLSALLLGDRLLIPDGVPRDVVPPAPLLWGALGVVRPPAGAVLQGAVRDGEGATLRYRVRSGASAGYWTYRTRGSALVSAEWIGNDGARRLVRLTAAGAGLPARATYTHERALRELTLERTLQEEVDGFPADVWRLEGDGS